MPEIKQVIIERDLNPYQSFFASFIAGLSDLGLLNQGYMNIVAKKAAEHLYAYLDAKDILPDIKTVSGSTSTEVIKNLVSYINEKISLVGEYDIQQVDEEHVSLIIMGNTCRICPEGVGGAELKGTLCPIPSLLENLINNIAQQDIVELITNGIEKNNGTCVANYKVQM